MHDIINENGICYCGPFPNLLNDDTLLVCDRFYNMFDCLVGNPPFVRVKNLTNADSVRGFEFSSSGMTDLYITFFDVGIKMLNNTGRLCYITPKAASCQIQISLV